VSIDDLDFTNVMRKPRDYGNPNTFEFVPVEGQTQEELDELVEVWKQLLVPSDPPPRASYLYATLEEIGQRAWADKFLSLPQALELAEGKGQSSRPSELDPGQMIWVRHPGQTAEALAALVAKVQKAFKKGERARRKWKSDYQGPDGDFEQWERQQAERRKPQFMIG